MQHLAFSQSRWRSTLALVASGVFHTLAARLLLAPGAAVPPPDLSTLLPAFYRYAPDRVKSMPREFRLELPEAPPAPPRDGPAPVALTLQPLPGVPAAGAPSLPPGVVSVDLDTVFSLIAVDSEVVRDPWSIAPEYPDDLLGAGLEGEVEAEFVVDTTGWVDLETVRLVFSSHEAFSRAVEAALPGMHFRPAWRGPRKVRQLVVQRFAFRFVVPPVPPAPARS